MLAFVPALPCNKWPSPRARAKCGGTMARSFCRGGGDGFTVIDCCWSHVKSCVLLKIPKNITPLSCIIRLNSLPPRSLHFWPHNPQISLSIRPVMIATPESSQHPLISKDLRRNSVILFVWLSRIAKSRTNPREASTTQKLRLRLLGAPPKHRARRCVALRARERTFSQIQT